MAALVVSNASIPDSRFSCPANNSGADYANIPWTNLTTAIFYGTEDDQVGLCGIKGPHPRMAFCCKYAHPGIVTGEGFNNASIALSSADDCTQYCPFGLISLDLWLYCLTDEGHTVSNAFCASPDGNRYDTSGSLPRDGPFDSDDPLIKAYLEHRSAGSTVRVSGTWVWLLFGMLAIVLLNGGV